MQDHLRKRASDAKGRTKFSVQALSLHKHLHQKFSLYVLHCPASSGFDSCFADMGWIACNQFTCKYLYQQKITGGAVAVNTDPSVMIHLVSTESRTITIQIGSIKTHTCVCVRACTHTH